jgi:hypothetical protein
MRVNLFVQDSTHGDLKHQRWLNPHSLLGRIDLCLCLSSPFPAKLHHVATECIPNLIECHTSSDCSNYPSLPS